MESQPQNPKFRNNHENFHPWKNSAESDQMPQNAASGQILHSLPTESTFKICIKLKLTTQQP